MMYYVFNILRVFLEMAMVSCVYLLTTIDFFKYGFRWWYIILASLIMVLIIGRNNLMKHNESTWMFLFVLTMIPMNIQLSVFMCMWYMVTYRITEFIIINILLNLTILVVEEILFGIIARLLWPDQKESYYYCMKQDEYREKRLEEQKNIF